jgi:type I restriction enzyme M protein
MLDSVTKRRIDTARDILVGKIPDPKSQVEQITIALIYKFMDDMDRESEEMDGKKHFFTGDLEKYSWTHLMSPETGGQAALNLYSEALTKFETSPNLPQLFRDIYKNSFLPYRDPETLRLFLKTSTNLPTNIPKIWAMLSSTCFPLWIRKVTRGNSARRAT